MAYTAANDPAGTRRANAYRGAAPALSATAYAGLGYGPKRAVTTEDLLECRGVSRRGAAIRYDVWDQGLSPIGTVDVVATKPPKVRNDSTRDINRTLDGILVDPVTAAELDVIAARLVPTVILEDGTEWPLGVFLFADASRNRRRPGLELSGSLHDQLFLAVQPIRRSTSYPTGTNLGAIIEDQAERAGFPAINVDPTDRVAAGPLHWPAGKKRIEILEEVATMAAMTRPYCTNAGVFTARTIVPDEDLGDPALVYNAGGRIIADAATETDDLLDAPNVFVVMDGGATDSPIVGAYTIPASSPISIENRGFAVTSVRTLQGLESKAAANEAAAADAANAGLGYELVTFDAIPDYRHDTYDPITYLGELWHETAWEVEVSPTATMRHEARKAYTA